MNPMNTGDDVVGLVPAAGKARRLGSLPLSKELYPVGFFRDEESGELRPKVATHHLFDKFRRAGVLSAYVIVREGKWDIPAYLGEGRLVGMHLAYVVVTDTIGPPDSVDRAYHFIPEKTVAFGFPDILFGPDDVFVQLLRGLHETGSDLCLGLYPAHEVSEADMIDIDQTRRIRAVFLKPQSSDLTYTWICAVWTPTFSTFMHEFVKRERETSDRRAYHQMDPQGDLPVGAVIKAAVEQGIHVSGLPFPDDRYIDIGTPDNLIEVVRKSTLS
jgi:glucose-1-phosphate thymidylyltransferase